MTDTQFAEIMQAMEVMNAKLDKLSAPKVPTLLPTGNQAPLVPNPPEMAKVYYADMQRFGGPEAFARQIRQREGGWPDSKPASMSYNCWSREKAGDAVADMIQAFKNDYPDLFKK